MYVVENAMLQQSQNKVPKTKPAVDKAVNACVDSWVAKTKTSTAQHHNAAAAPMA